MAGRRTATTEITAGVLQIYTRTDATAMMAAGLDFVSTAGSPSASVRRTRRSLRDST